jgi:hypothetical protein
VQYQDNNYFHFTDDVYVSATSPKVLQIAPSGEASWTSLESTCDPLTYFSIIITILQLAMELAFTSTQMLKIVSN